MQTHDAGELTGFLRKNWQHQALSVSDDGKRAPRTDLSVGQQAMEVIDAGHWFVIERDNHVA
ncbi:MAG: hypothetical protein WBV60_12150, partial [Terriglobales bacterium]